MDLNKLNFSHFSEPSAEMSKKNALCTRCEKTSSFATETALNNAQFHGPTTIESGQATHEHVHNVCLRSVALSALPC